MDYEPEIKDMILCLMIVIISIDRCILELFGGDDHSHHRGSVNLGDQPVFLSTSLDRWTRRSSWKGCKTAGYHCIIALALHPAGSRSCYSGHPTLHLATLHQKTLENSYDMSLNHVKEY